MTRDYFLEHQLHLFVLMRKGKDLSDAVERGVDMEAEAYVVIQSEH